MIYALATIGLACVRKNIRVMPCEEDCFLCGWHKPKIEEVKSKVEGLKTKVEGFKTKIHGEKKNWFKVWF